MHVVLANEAVCMYSVKRSYIYIYGRKCETFTKCVNPPLILQVDKQLAILCGAVHYVEHKHSNEHKSYLTN